MKKTLIILLVGLFLLSACTLGGSSTSTVDEIKTAIFLTATNWVSKTPLPVMQASPLPMTITLTSTPVPPANTATASATLPPVIPPVYASPVPVIPPPVSWNPYYANQFIYYYYQHINNRDYLTTWSLLTDNFKAVVNGPATGGYSGYVNYWNTVKRVDILSLYLTNFTGYTSDVTVDMVYNYYNGTVTRTTQPFHLYYDVLRGTWMFNTLVPVSSGYPSTPDGFVSYYFNNINARNYGITWSLLTPNFIAANNSTGYDDYAGYWNSVARVDVNHVTINSQSSDTANVTVGLTFNKMDTTVASMNITYNLIYNSALGSWQFHTP